MNSTFDQSKTANEKPGSDDTSGEVSLINKESPPNYVTFRNRIITDETTPAIAKEFREFQNTIVNIMEKWFASQDEKLSKILNDFEEMKKSVHFVSMKNDELQSKIESTEKLVTAMDKTLEAQVVHISNLEARIEAMEQHSRQCNIEISNLPERKGENLISLVEKIGDSIKYTIAPTDIVLVHRVPHFSTKNSHPKNIVVKFSSRIIRDNILAAARLAGGLHTTNLGVTGDSHRVYINEHLTLKNKLLLRDAKIAAKNNNFRFVWVKHGSILARETETSPVVVVRTSTDITKIKPKRV